MIRLLLFLVVLAAVFVGPQLWIKRVFAQHSKLREDFPGTGGELARHLLDRFRLEQVQVETTDTSDHYDPIKKIIRLTPENFHGKSLTAATIAAHEVGHALQDQAGYAPLKERTRFVRIAQGAEKVGAFVMLGIPLVAGITRAPGAGILVMCAGIATMGVGTLIHLLTLPVEWDASFKRALPVLERGGYLSREDLVDARTILRAAALTYVAGSMASLLNLWRWVAMMRR
ncbi:MAG: zinc metallopeptidase [Nitrospirales bacterium]|nr:zinc metallopeptidase [Nitrospira sp.]MDR4500987.1 zinc metallopeptidase [Nitrospirales bacterium]